MNSRSLRPSGHRGSFRHLEWKPLEARVSRSLESLAVGETDPFLAAFLKSGLRAPSVPNAPDVQIEFRVLLEAAAEIEHALMVQYLYAYYSHEGSDIFRTVAIQEMGHLFSVQNVLRVLDHPVHLLLPDPSMPEAQDAFPFPLVLQPASVKSLGQYVTAESPLIDLLPEPQRTQAAAAARDASIQVNHVGVLFLKLYWMTQPSDESFGPWTLTPRWRDVLGSRHLPSDLVLQTDRQRSWGSLVEMDDPDYLEKAARGKLFVAHLRDSALIFLREQLCRLFFSISAQGEGWVDDPGRQSHFELFLELYNAWTTPSPPADIINAAENPWVGPPSADAELEKLRITHPESEVLAKAFNLRYERILQLIALTFADGVPATLISTIRSQAVGTDMRSNTASLARALLERPLKEGGISTSVRAGPPFQAPASLPVDLPGIKARLEAIRSATLALNNEFPAGVDPIDTSPDQALLDQLP